MARLKKPKPPLIWIDVAGSDEMSLGRYAVDGRMIVVQSRQGWEKTTQLGNPEAQAGLARLMLSEAPPSHWCRPAQKDSAL